LDSKDLFEQCSLCENIILCAPSPLWCFILSTFTFLSFLYNQLFSLLHPPIFLHDLLLLCFILLHFSTILAFILLTHSMSYNFCPPASSPPLPSIFYFLLSICAINEPITSFSSRNFLSLHSVLYPLEFLFTAFSEVVSLKFSVCLVAHPTKLNVLEKNCFI